jgi:hypothetical protein
MDEQEDRTPPTKDIAEYLAKRPQQLAGVLDNMEGIAMEYKQRAERAEARVQKLELIHDLACDVLAAATEPYAIEIKGGLLVPTKPLKVLGAAINEADLAHPYRQHRQRDAAAKEEAQA